MASDQTENKRRGEIMVLGVLCRISRTRRRTATAADFAGASGLSPLLAKNEWPDTRSFSAAVNDLARNDGGAHAGDLPRGILREFAIEDAHVALQARAEHAEPCFVE